ncbi:M16 family metallopeptidase [Croceiramulus getboli]|nr:pitrilysin family protein [Flavobacteriaceae bacterium YJPT1-3]
MIKITFRLTLLMLLALGCTQKQDPSADASFQVAFEEYTLDNGLQVILHEDHSDPVVAVALTAHVGSAREKEGRTGFAHLFEHLLFLESENLGKGGLDQLSARVGGSGANGSTSRDRTNYFQTVPKDALEKMIWAEADKLGYFINTVTEPVLAKEKQVVKNEKRQGVDNRPYGHQRYVTGKNLYPKDHPYNWQVIGSLEDLQNATLEDVKEFYRQWYVPNNVTLTIAGDFDPEQAKAWVENYFGEIPAGEPIAPLEKRIPTLAETKNLYYEDNFARLPQLNMTWPSVYEYHPDSYPLSVLATYLAEGKEAPLYEVLVAENQFTSQVNAFQFGSEMAGEFIIQVRANTGVDLDSVKTGIDQAFAQFIKEGIPEADLNRIKAQQESAFYNQLSSVLGKGFQLAQYQIFAGDPGYINEDVQKILDVTPEDVKRVFNEYIYNKPYVATSFVPQGKQDLALSGAQEAQVVEEAIVANAEEEVDPNVEASYEPTPSSFDRSQEPPYGASPDLSLPDLWTATLTNGLALYGTYTDEVPMVNFEWSFRGGQLLETKEKAGITTLMAELMDKGTATKTPAELEAALAVLGASIYIVPQQEQLSIRGSTLAKNYDQTMDLLQELLLQPRWDEEEFNLAKQKILTSLEQQQSSPLSLADLAFAKAIYGDDHILSSNIFGTPESIAQLSLEAVKQHFETTLVPNESSLHLVGPLNESRAKEPFADLSSYWSNRSLEIPAFPEPQAPESPIIYFVDVPEAKQSQLRFGYPALAATHPDFYPATIMNYRLGGGGFASELTQQLREGKGYTYGIRSRFEGSRLKGPFEISSGVRTNVTYESTALIKEILTNYGPDFDENDLEITQGFLLKSGARAFETPGAKLNYLRDISQLGYEPDYLIERQEEVKAMTVARIQELARQYLNPNRMYYIIVGDANTQFDRLSELGLGTPVKMDEALAPLE